MFADLSRPATDVDNLVEQLKLRINNVKDIAGDHDAHSVLAETVQLVKSVLFERDSDGLGFKISNKSERRKLLNQYKKAVAILNNVAVTGSWPATIIKADDPGSSPAAIAAHPETYPFNPLFGMFTSALRENLCKMTQNHRTFGILKMKTERDTHEISVRVMPMFI